MIKIIDCTLRDGSYINNSEFGYSVIKSIINNLISSKIDVIEAGWLRDEKYSLNRAVFSSLENFKNIYDDKQMSEYALMLQYGQYNINNLEHSDGSLKHIRFAFHKNEIKYASKICEKIIEKGYKCHINPINLPSYSVDELKFLINLVNDILPDTLTIVDTIGCLTEESLLNLNNFLGNNLDTCIGLGIHLHEHLSMSYSLAQTFIKINKLQNRNISIDASLNGIGRIPGNLCIELILPYLNLNFGKQYEISYIYDAIDNYINPIKSKKNWGYSVVYSISANLKVHRNYVEFLLNKDNMKINDVKKLLELIPKEEKDIFNKACIENICKNNYV